MTLARSSGFFSPGNDILVFFTKSLGLVSHRSSVSSSQTAPSSPNALRADEYL